jgi:citrate synthase
MSDDRIKVNLEGSDYEFDVIRSVIGNTGIDIRKLRPSSNHVTYDPGFANTASSKSTITYVDGSQGELRHRGYRIEDLAEHSSFLEVTYLLLFGDLPTKPQLDDWVESIRNHTLLSEEMKRFFDAFPRSAHPMAILSSATNAISTFYEKYHTPGDLDAYAASAIRLQEVDRPAVRVPPQRPDLCRELPPHDVRHPGRADGDRPGLEQGTQRASRAPRRP